MTTRKPISFDVIPDESDNRVETRRSYYAASQVLSDALDYIEDPQYGLTQFEKDYLKHEVSLMICAALY